MTGPTTERDRRGTPTSRSRIVDLYFMEHRAKILDIAAFLDRVDRASQEGDGDDFRMIALRRALRVLAETDPGRARRVLDLMSDPTSEPIDRAGTKGAAGAYPGGNGTT